MPVINGVSPLSATQDETVTFDVTGSNFPQMLTFSVENCAPVQTFAPETCTTNQCQFTCTTNQCQFTCTPSTAGTQAGTIKDDSGNSLYTFNVEVQAAPISESQCAVYNPVAVPQVSIPCVDVSGTMYSAGLNIVPAPGLRFAVDMNALQVIDAVPSADCAAYPFGSQNRLRLNCVDVGGIQLWAELELTPNPAAVEFDLADYDNR